MKKGQSPLSTGIILCAAGIYLAIYFSLKGMWGAGSIIAIFMIAAIAAFQFFIYFKLFKSADPLKKAKSKKNFRRK